MGHCFVVSLDPSRQNLSGDTTRMKPMVIVSCLKGSEFGIVTQETITVNCEHPPAFITFYDLRNKDVPLPVSTYMPFEMIHMR